MICCWCGPRDLAACLSSLACHLVIYDHSVRSLPRDMGEGKGGWSEGGRLTCRWSGLTRVVGAGLLAGGAPDGRRAERGDGWARDGDGGDAEAQSAVRSAPGVHWLSAFHHINHTR